MSAVATIPTSLNAAQVLGFIKDPLKQLPEDWRLATWDFWAFFSHLLSTQLPLCTRIRVWRDSDGLTLDELRRAFDRMRSLERSATCQFASQVLAGLAESIEEVRKADREAERKRKEQESERAYTAAEFIGAKEAWASMKR